VWTEKNIAGMKQTQVPHQQHADFLKSVHPLKHAHFAVLGLPHVTFQYLIHRQKKVTIMLCDLVKFLCLMAHYGQDDKIHH
jgi:hypothetical protein